MQRVFLEDCGRYRRGEIKDWPRGTWEGISPRWERITRPVEDVLNRRLDEARLAELEQSAEVELAPPIMPRRRGRPPKYGYRDEE